MIIRKILNSYASSVICAKDLVIFQYIAKNSIRFKVT